MTEEHPRTSAEVADDDESLKLPRWVPLTIGIALVIIAGLAVYTGLTYRQQGIGRAFRRLPMMNRVDRGGAPGEPEAGASRMMHGVAGDTIPVPEPGSGDYETRVAITGGADGVVPSIRLSARRGVILKVEPSDAIVYVNDAPMGTAAQFSTPEQVWEFPDVPEGTFTIRLEAPGYRAYEYVVTSDPDAETEVATLEVKLAKR